MQEPYDGTWPAELDDEFVRGASREEPSSAERAARAARIVADHQRLVDEGRVVVPLQPARRALRGGGRPWRGPSGPAPRSGQRVGTVVGLLVVVLAVGATVAVRTVHAAAPSSRTSPTPGFEEAPAPLGAPPATSGATGTYRFLYVQADGTTPVAWDPCRPIHYVVRPTGAPPGSATLVRAAVARVSAATGLRFIADGETDEGFSKQREPFQPERYGDRWVPLLIAWSTVEENPDFAATVIGEGGATPVRRRDGTTVYVTGAVDLDTATLGARMRAAPGEVQAVIEHELGHVMGLDHVTDRYQLMYPEAQLTAEDFGAGDLAGLAALGRGTCAPDL